MSTVSPRTSRETATPLTDGCNNNRMVQLSKEEAVAAATATPYYYYAPDRREGAISVAFVRLSVCPSVCSFGYNIANNSRTQRPSVTKFGMTVPHLRCDSHASFKVKRSKVKVIDGRGHTVLPEPSGHTTCYFLFKRLTLL